MGSTGENSAPSRYFRSGHAQCPVIRQHHTFLHYINGLAYLWLSGYSTPSRLCPNMRLEPEVLHVPIPGIIANAREICCFPLISRASCKPCSQTVGVRSSVRSRRGGSPNRRGRACPLKKSWHFGKDVIEAPEKRAGEVCACQRFLYRWC